MPDDSNEPDLSSQDNHLALDSSRAIEHKSMSPSNADHTEDKAGSHSSSKSGVNDHMSAMHSFGDSVALSEKQMGAGQQTGDGEKETNGKSGKAENVSVKKESKGSGGKAEGHEDHTKGVSSAAVSNASSGTGIHTTGMNSAANAGISFDYGSWEEAAEELNFLNDTTALGMESGTGAMPGASANAGAGSGTGSGTGNVTSAGGAGSNGVFSPVNTASSAAPSPSDYAFQLQQYQNLLLEAQQETTHQGVGMGSGGKNGPRNAGGSVLNTVVNPVGPAGSTGPVGPVAGGMTGVFRAKKVPKAKGRASGLGNGFSSYSMGSFENFSATSGGSPNNAPPGSSQQYNGPFSAGGVSSSAVSSPATPGQLSMPQMQSTLAGMGPVALQQYQGQYQGPQQQQQQQQQQLAALQMAQLAAAGQQQMLRGQFASAYNSTNAATRRAIDIGFRNGLLAGSGAKAAGETPRGRRRKSPPQPRTKVRPCDHCRRRKTKCIMIPEIHSCKMCQEKGLKCTFTDTARSLKRGLERGAGGSSSGNGEGSDKRMKMDDPSIEPPPNIAVRNVHPIRDYATMRGKSLLKKTLSLQYPRSSFYVGATSIYDPIFLPHIALDKIDQFSLDKSNSVRKVADDVQFVLRDDFSEALYEKSERDADTVERYVAPHGKALIDLYFRTVHPSFPILHKKIFLEKYARTHREFGAPLLAAVYLLAIQWWDYDPALSQFPKPNVESLHRFAIRAFGDVIRRPKLSAVQAGLLLLQCRTPDSADKNWLLSSQVVAVAEDLGLGLECGHWRLPRWERGLRRRLAWAVFIQDKWSSLVEARPSHIVQGRDWLVGKVSLEDFPEKANDDPDSLRAGSSDVENGRKAFVHMVSLSEILSEILDTFYTRAAMLHIRSIDNVLLHAKPLQLKLRNWYHSLPKDLQMASIKPRHFNSNGTLQLAYFATEITLHRRIIAALHSQHDPAPPQQLVRVCRNAAKTRLTASIEFARDLKAEHMQAFWYSSAVHNFALIGIFAALLYVTSSSPHEAAAYKEQLFDYRWILKVNSHSFDVASRALEKIDGVLKNIPALLQEPETTASGSPIHDAKHQPAISSTTQVHTSGSLSPASNTAPSGLPPPKKT